MTRFNPLDVRSALVAITPPTSETAWMEHLPFAHAIVELLRPRVLVELGVHTGASYLAFCEAIAALGLPTAAFGVDTFVGDEHAGAYGAAIEARLRATHDPKYGAFSRIVRSTFDDAAAHVADGSVDLLHIDGFHTYEAVAHDFHTWLPKLSARGVVLFHDVNVRERDFGVWRFWAELRARYAGFEFKHGHGLGVLSVGAELPEAARPLFEATPDDAERIERLFFLLGSRVGLQASADAQQREATQRERELGELRARVARLEDAQRALLDERDRLSRHANELAASLAQTNRSLSFRVGMGATAPLRWIAERITRR